MTSLPLLGASPGNGRTERPGALHQMMQQLSVQLKNLWPGRGDSVSQVPPPVSARRNAPVFSPRLKKGVFRVLMIVLWVWVIIWGERRIFKQSFDLCEWNQWESWPSNASPHHVVMIADPQLVDPHTYPGRPWPLSSLTIMYTDLYLRRTYSYLQRHLQPDTVFFLGDLFDGGREWATQKSHSPEQRYQRYGDKFWKREYKRFRKIFFDRFILGGSVPSDPSAPTRKLIASLPGNHDLGFGSGIQEPVKERFEAYFGNGNRVDIIGNHTFVSVDTVSLSALDQADPVTGSSGSAEGSSSSEAMRALWKPVQDFLLGVKAYKGRLITQEVLRMTKSHRIPYYQEASTKLLSADVVPLHAAKPMVHDSPPISIPAPSLFPNILLTHVPLWRQPGADCGPMRERGRSIPINAGYQYQNALTPVVSEVIMDLVGAAETSQVFSGDDHDYCDYTHREFTGGVKETTVKSISWAMGVRRPGFVSVSLWNPVELSGAEDANSKTPEDTIQQNLCLLPDQLGIFIRYAQLLGFSLLLILIQTYDRTIRIPQLEAQRNSTSLLPSFNPHSKTNGHARKDSTSITSSTNTTSDDYSTYLSARTTSGNTSKARSTPPSQLGDYGNVPTYSRSASPSKEHHSAGSVYHAAVDYDDWGMPTSQRRRRIGFRGFLWAFKNDIWGIAWPVTIFYTWIIWNG